MKTCKTQRHLASYFEHSVQQFPDHIAVVGPDGRSLTYRELHDRANRVAGFLAANGIQPGARIGLILPKSVDAVAILLGIMKARAAYVPADWTAPVERNYTILRDCQAQALFVDSRVVTSLMAVAQDSFPGTVVSVPVTGEEGEASSPCTQWRTILSHVPLQTDASARTEDDLAYILYTSGSTGKPKGVMLTQENACAFVDWCSETFLPTAEDRFSSHAPFHFDLSILDLYVPLKHGASVHLIGEDLAQNPR
ncbi:MAG: AMP-binding protein, partial [Deltaproteobacteria bacterium]|nr:AMP-binding protein [Deltaproteobacteria bacterium]